MGVCTWRPAVHPVGNMCHDPMPYDSEMWLELAAQPLVKMDHAILHG